jgi:hypothetical protein
MNFFTHMITIFIINFQLLHRSRLHQRPLLKDVWFKSSIKKQRWLSSPPRRSIVWKRRGKVTITVTFTLRRSEIIWKRHFCRNNMSSKRIEMKTEHLTASRVNTNALLVFCLQIKHLGSQNSKLKCFEIFWAYISANLICKQNVIAYSVNIDWTYVNSARISLRLMWT